MSLKNRNELDAYYNSTRDIRTICKCGNRIKLPVMKSYIICTWCGRKIVNKTKARFMYVLKKKMEEENGN